MGDRHDVISFQRVGKIQRERERERERESRSASQSNKSIKSGTSTNQSANQSGSKSTLKGLSYRRDRICPWNLSVDIIFPRQILFWIQTTIMGNAMQLDSHASESFQKPITLVRVAEGGQQNVVRSR